MDAVLPPPLLPSCPPMNKKVILVALISTCFACSSAAQQMYKSVGADGKITFSDKMSKDEKAKISVMRGNILRPTETALPAAPAAVLPTPPKVRPTPADSGNEPAKSKLPPSAELETAVLAVMMLSEVARRFEPLCSPTPVAARAYGAAVNGWKQRNANFIERQTRVLMEVYNPHKRAEMQTKVNTKIDAAEREVKSLNEQWRAKWCTKAIQDMIGGANDIANDATLAVPLITNRP